MLRLSRDPHPRDERACLPKISSPHSIYRVQIALLEQIYGYDSFHSKLFNNYFEIIEIIQIFAAHAEIILKLI